MVPNRKSSQSKAYSVAKLSSQKIQQPSLLSSGSKIEFQEFNLQTDRRGQRKQYELEEKLKEQELQESEKKQFRATPVPNYNELSQQFINSGVRSPKPTVPLGFNLQTLQRSKLMERSSVDSVRNMGKSAEL